MSRKVAKVFYSAQTGWTKVGIAEQKRRASVGIPWNLRENLANIGRFLYAVLLTFAWGSSRKSPKPVICSHCGWVGPLKWTLHEEERYGSESQQVDVCPRCNITEPFRPVFGRRNGVWCS
jgi:hypothetical protein